MIEVEHLSKSYGSFQAVRDVSFTCRRGAVTGFLGPNGAGKSTVMRIISGLTPATSGKAVIAQTRYQDIPNPGTQVGVLLDASAQHKGRTGREVLLLGAKVMGLGESRVDEMLDLVGLTQAEAKRTVGNYSLGMRQRIGLAHALLGEPKVLILDEPANGLDPAGIHWMRSLLRHFADRGGTVMLSSHLLHEVQIIADDIIVIGNGEIVAQGAKEELLRSAGTYVHAIDMLALSQALTAAGIAATPSGNGVNADAPLEQVAQVAADAGVALMEIRPSEGGLEEMFLNLTAPVQRDQPTEGAH